jgi:glycosyltransferase involved in cell wall biosynthesis
MYDKTLPRYWVPPHASMSSQSPDAPRLSVAFLIRRLDPGGAQRQLSLLARALRQRGHDVHVIVLYGGGQLEQELVDAGVGLHVQGKRGRWDLPDFLARLVRTGRAVRPDVVYSYLDMSNILALAIYPFIGRPRLVWGIRAAFMDMRNYDWLTRLLPWVEARLSRFAHAIIANSRAGERWATVRGMPADRLAVVFNGIDTAYYHHDPDARARLRSQWQIDDKTLLVGHVGRLDPIKDHPNLLHACARLLAKHRALRFVFVGDGPETYRSKLRAMSADLGLDERLIWAGERHDMRGELGEVVPPGDSALLAAAIERAINRRLIDAGLPARLRDRVETLFSQEQMVRRTERILAGQQW